MSPTVLSPRRRQGLSGRHVAAIFATFFGTIFLMNGMMMYWAISTHTGIVSNEPYRKGLHYNDRIAADDRQTRLGWTDAVTVARDGRVVVELAGGAGQPIRGVRMEAQLGRPSTNRHDHRLELREVAPGRYEGQAGPLGEGSWIIALEVRSDPNATDPDYRKRRRLWLKP